MTDPAGAQQVAPAAGPAAKDVDRPAGLGVLLAACISAFVVNANTSAVTILLPSISEDVHSSVAKLQWAVTGYSLMGAAVIVTSGALGDVFGRRKVFLGGLALFVGSCVLIALSTSGAGVVGGRVIQGASGATILACGMSLLSVAASGKGQLSAVTIWGAASAAGGAAGPLVGGVLVDATGWQGLFWIDAGIALACVPLTLKTVEESNDPSKPRTIDWAGTVLVACIFVPLVLALSEGNDWGWGSWQTLLCFAISIVSAYLFVRVESRSKAPLVNLALLRNRILVGATLAILIVAGTINGLMYVLSLYFQNPEAFGFSPLQAGLATLPAAAGMIIITPFITRLASRIGAAPVVALGFGLAAAGFAALAFVKASWGYGAFVLPLVGLAVGLGFANGPASSGSTAAVAPEEVGQASGISNMARYVGAALAVAAVAMLFNAVINNHLADGASQPDALAAGLSSACLLMAILSACGVGLVVFLRHHRPPEPEPADLAAAAASPLHTIPVPQRSS
ncbi:MAG TPA: MFS transporter [Thermoleophilaceae bacterium]|nr:MFS transporter [Thermoleophilaceae bacterium]